MPAYKAPLREIKFILTEVLQAENMPQQVPDFVDATPDVIEAILEEAGKFCEEVLQPLNHPGDEEGCHYDNGTVTTPKGFKEAYATFIEGGWPSLPCDPEYGGQGLPKLVNFAVEEMICSANLSFGMYPGLSNGNYNAIHAHGSDEQKALYLPKLVDGSWTGTMCLTEPQCGTDLGLCKTRAEANPDGSYKLYGTKIFISAGEHDFTENIIHLVLARLPDAPAGIRGISLFICPKFLPDADGKPGARNPVVCGSIEKKMGIKASSTCVMNFDGAQAWLIGQPNKGMSAMFTMMNTARLAVGMQGLGIAEAAYQGAVTYARDRLQMRALTGAKFPEKAADPIIVHPDVRRMLLTMRSQTEAARALAYWVGQELDYSQHHPDPERRQEADDLVALLTPIVKAFLTDHGFDAANLGVQVYGGHGYIRAWSNSCAMRASRRSMKVPTVSRRSTLWGGRSRPAPAVSRGASSTRSPTISSRQARSRRWRNSSCRSPRPLRSCNRQQPGSPRRASPTPMRPAPPRPISSVSSRWWPWGTCGAAWSRSRWRRRMRMRTASTPPRYRMPASSCCASCRRPMPSSPY